VTFAITDFKAKGFRSLRSVSYPMSRLDVFVGANGVGKTNLYRALELMRAAADNTIARDLAGEGGLSSAQWAGPRRSSGPLEINLAASLADPSAGPDAARYRYELSVGWPSPTAAAFAGEPEIKTESLDYMRRARPLRLLERKGLSVVARADDDRAYGIDLDLLPSETALGRLEDPSRFPELDLVRRTLQQWRFYHGFRTDSASPLRRPCPAVATPVLAADGSDLAAVFATLAWIRHDRSELDAAIEAAFPGAELVVLALEGAVGFAMVFPEFPQRRFSAAELSDGTLRFLALAAALLAYRLPPFIALNEPEASLHPDLMEPLAGMVVNAARRSQVWLVTHSERLAHAVSAKGGGKVRTVLKSDGATTVEGLKAWGEFAAEE
jgi:predicted ATPase